MLWAGIWVVPYSWWMSPVRGLMRRSLGSWGPRKGTPTPTPIPSNINQFVLVSKPQPQATNINQHQAICFVDLLYPNSWGSNGGSLGSMLQGKPASIYQPSLRYLFLRRIDPSAVEGIPLVSSGAGYGNVRKMNFIGFQGEVFMFFDIILEVVSLRNSTDFKFSHRLLPCLRRTSISDSVAPVWPAPQPRHLL